MCVCVGGGGGGGGGGGLLHQATLPLCSHKLIQALMALH